MTKLLMVPVLECNVNSLSAHTSVHQPINPFIQPPINLPNFNLSIHPPIQPSILSLSIHPSIIPSTNTAFGKTFVTLGTGYKLEKRGTRAMEVSLIGMTHLQHGASLSYCAWVSASSASPWVCQAWICDFTNLEQWNILPLDTMSYKLWGSLLLRNLISTGCVTWYKTAFGR